MNQKQARRFIQRIAATTLLNDANNLGAEWLYGAQDPSTEEEIQQFREALEWFVTNRCAGAAASSAVVRGELQTLRSRMSGKSKSSPDGPHPRK